MEMKARHNYVSIMLKCKNVNCKGQCIHKQKLFNCLSLCYRICTYITDF